jgi:glycosidase
MIRSINSPEFQGILGQASSRRIEKVKLGRRIVPVPVPFPSPEDWRDHPIYFLMIDRFNNPEMDPKWDDPNCDDFQGGNLRGITEKLDYIKSLGVGALWITPPFKNCAFEKSYYGYGIQDFLAIDPRFGSDGTPETADRELQNLVIQAHARSLYVIFDVVLNHAGNVFFYKKDGDFFSYLEWRDVPYDVMWRDKDGDPRWTYTPEPCDPDECVWPKELQKNEYFRRRGMGGEEAGDFWSLKELVTEYYRYDDGYYRHPVWDALIKAYQHAIARYDVDGFRIDTLKYVERKFARTFGNSMREFALAIGKKNFFTFGEVWDDEAKITRYIGRYSSDEDGIIGVDAALDFPLFGRLAGTIKGFLGPDQVARVFEERKQYQKSHIGYHGEAGKFFVTFLDNHDQMERFYYKDGTKYDPQVTGGIAALFTLQGIPCIYYGTEQGLHGRGGCLEAVREALWRNSEGHSRGQPFDEEHPFYLAIQEIARIREAEPALRYGRQYFREVSGNGYDFGISTERGGVLAYSRILNDREVLTAVNTSVERSWTGMAIVDYSLSSSSTPWRTLYSNLGRERRELKTEKIPDAMVQKIRGERFFGPVRVLPLHLEPMEAQIIRKGE